MSHVNMLHDALSAVCPHIDGISIGTEADRATWRVDFRPEATADQRTAAASVIASFDVLALLKATERAAVNEAAEQQRLKRITGGATKAMEYMEARDQAVAVLAMGEAAANALPNHGFAEFPVLSASVPIEAASLYAAAQLVSGRYELYVSIAGQIKAKAIAAKAAITAATTEDQVRAVRGAIVWP